jgi:signal transduction histidine kinase/HAMP domain-containing protein/ActR/RegA family two-component response regulator
MSTTNEAPPPAPGRPPQGLQSIRYRLPIWAAASIALLGLIVGSGSVLIAYRHGRGQIIDQLVSVAVLKEAEIRRWARELQWNLLVLAQDGNFIESAPRMLELDRDHTDYQSAENATVDLLLMALVDHAAFEDFYILDRQGEIVASTDPAIIGENRRLYPYFTAGLHKSGIHVQTVSFSGGDADLNSVVVVTPIQDAGGRPLGVLAGKAELDALNDIMLQWTGLGETGETYLVGTNHVLLTAVRFPNYYAGQLYIRTEGSEAALQTKREGNGTYRDYRGEQVIGVYRWLPELEVALLAEQDQQEAFRSVYLTIWLNIGVIALATLLMTAITIAASRSITRPLSDLSKTAAEIARGNLNQVAEVERDDEVGQLAVLFNDMTARLKTMLETESERAAMLEGEIAERERVESERLQLLEQVRDQAQQLNLVIDTVPEGVVLLAQDGQILRVNRLGKREMAFLADADVGDRISELGDRPLDDLLAPPPGGLWHEVEKEGRHYQVLAQSFSSSTAPPGWVVVIRDVTQQREFEQRVRQQERLAAVGQLAAGIAHDFNNIMAVISLYAQLVGRSPGLSPRDEERIQVVNQQSLQATQLIQQILDFSRPTLAARHDLDLAPMLKEEVKLLERTLPDHILLSLTHGPDRCIVRADPTRIRQMLMNLALNARDAMTDGGEIHISLARVHKTAAGPGPLPEMAPGDWIKLSVEDTGTGISTEALPHIFEPFFTTKPAGKGSGLGLSQVHGIVSAHGGHIDVRSACGKGTVFNIYLPAREEVQEAEASRDAGEETTPAGQGETILVVEDNAGTRAALADSLTQIGYHVLEADQGEAAIRLLDESEADVDLILTDAVMPTMGGFALVKELDRRGRRLPVILISGHILDSGVDMAQSAAELIVTRLTKPVQLDRLAHAIHRALTMHRENVG